MPTHCCLSIFKRTWIMAGLMFLSFLLSSQPLLAQEVPPDRTKTFPGFNEVIPQATRTATMVSEAHSQIHEAEKREAVYNTLDVIVVNLEELERQNSDWENVTNWPINRLLRAQSDYAELRDQQTQALSVIYAQFQTLENLRSIWERERTYWQEWQTYLNKIDVEAPSEAFTRSLTNIDDLLKRINRVGGELVQAQQKYSPGQEVIDSRLSTITKTHEALRLDIFKRNTLTMFEADYYRQFNRNLLTDFKANMGTTLTLPANLFSKHAGFIGLHLFSILVISLLFNFRHKQDKPLTGEWSFIFRRRFSGSTFVTIAVMFNFTNQYAKIPLILSWLLILVFTIAAIRLANALYEQPQAKKMVRTIAIIFIVNESLRYIGLPTPLMQLYNAFLCIVAIPICWLIIRRGRGEPTKHLLVTYPIFGVSIIGLAANIFGNESFTTNLIDATLSTFILIVLLKMTLMFCKSGVDAFVQMEWVKNRHFMQVLQLEEVTQKLKTLLQVIIVVNSVFLMSVIWKIFGDIPQARDALLSFEYSFGDFSISIKMIVMVIVVLYLTTIVSWVIQAFVDSQIMTPKKMDVGVKESLKRLTHYGLFTVGFLVAVSLAGLDLQKFTILAGALGVGIGFGLQNIVNNFVSGLILLFERPVKVGDIINIDQDWGTIKKIGLRSTVFETFDRAEIIVPNADLISNKVTNWTFSTKIVRVNLPVGVAYGSPLEKVLEILNRAACEHPDVFSYPEPNSVFEAFGNSSIDFKLRFWIQSIDDRMRIRSEVAVIIDRLFREEGIQIPFPQQDLHLRSIDGNLKPFFRTNDSRGQTDCNAHVEGTPA